MRDIPANSLIFPYKSGSSFYDSFSTVIRYDNQSALELFLIMLATTPPWLNCMMSVRNVLAKGLGLKDLGRLTDLDRSKTADDYKMGDKVGIFRLFDNTQYEVMLEDQDSHLDVKLSLRVQPMGKQARVRVSTVVHEKNLLGTGYMVMVVPVHKIAVSSSLKRLAKGLKERPVGND